MKMAADWLCRSPLRQYGRLTEIKPAMKMVVKPAAPNGHTTMIDDWFSAIKLPLTIERIHQLPRNPAYK